MFPLSPPLTPFARPATTPINTDFDMESPSSASFTTPEKRAIASPSSSPDFALPPPFSYESMPNFELPDASLDCGNDDLGASGESHFLRSTTPTPSRPYPWRQDLSVEERDERELHLSGSRGRPGLRIVIVTENFLPKVDGVTRTLARLLEHLEKEGHQCMLLGPETGMSQYSSHPLVGTAGVPLVVYPGLKLNFLRPKFMRAIKDFQPDVIHFVDPIWLGAQTLMAMELGWAGEEWVSDGGPALGSGIRGAVVASYHTNLATYATLFGMAWLEPIMWRFQSWLYSKTLLTLCPSPSTLHMLEGQSFSGVRLWPRGVDLSQFGRHRRSTAMRAAWGVGEAHVPIRVKQDLSIGTHWQGQQASLPLTPPLTPWTGPVNHIQAPPPLPAHPSLPARVVLLYVGRISWEKNLHLLLVAYALLQDVLCGTGMEMPKMVFVGDGPAKAELEAICGKKGYDAVFMGHRSGQELAECYASADIFAFPSFTETFGQVVLEALASGLPVIGLDAEGTRDLVTHGETGLLLSIPLSASSSSNPSRTWPLICRNHTSPIFAECAKDYAGLLVRAVCGHDERQRMGDRGSTEGIVGYTWWDAMERCVDGYRESMRIARQKRQIEVITHNPPETLCDAVSIPQSPRTSRVNRLVSRRLAHRGQWESADEGVVGQRSGVGLFRRTKGEAGETVWHLKTLLKLFVVIALFYAVYRHHVGQLVGMVGFGEAGLMA